MLMWHMSVCYRVLKVVEQIDRADFLKFEQRLILHGVMKGSPTVML